MSWVRIDDHAHRHPKQLQAGPMACWLWVCGLSYCSEHLTDGNIPSAALATFNIPRPTQEAARLVAVGLWEVTETGYRVHDYGDYQPSKAQVRERRERTANRVTEWKKRQGHVAGDTLGNAPGNGVSNAIGNAVGNAVSNAPPIPIPIPIPQEPKVRTPLTPLKGGLRPAAARKRAEEIRSRAWGRCQHDPPCVSYDACITKIAEGLRANQSFVPDEATA